jgi:isocitrate/isopropylmalate dehydrogenase
MMLNHLGETAAADRIKCAYNNALAEGRPEELTVDIGGRAGTTEFTDALVRRVRESGVD